MWSSFYILSTFRVLMFQLLDKTDYNYNNDQTLKVGYSYKSMKKVHFLPLYTVTEYRSHHPALSQYDGSCIGTLLLALRLHNIHHPITEKLWGTRKYIQAIYIERSIETTKKKCFCCCCCYIPSYI